MTYFLKSFLTLVLTSLIALPAISQPPGFHYGTIITDHGPVATIEGREAIREGTRFKISFDVDTRAKEGEINRTLTTAARFLNMHAEAGIEPSAMALAIVVHGSAVHDMTNAAFNEAASTAPNPNAELIIKLLANGVRIHVCGQSAVFNGIKTENLLPGVTMSLSAMTAHALLQQDGYTLNPF